ncbi:type II secretion system F family protein [Pasteurella sp. PK-2025]|uniref:type II secretion system F family protein n=1 Tax=unclassified Pasteurella TaxID=2621516 RepID=UPI003C782629
MSKLKMYRWKGMNTLQQKQQGVIVAESELLAQQMLFSRGILGAKLQQNWQFSTSPTLTEICDLLTQLATLLQSALPLKEALQVLLQNCTQLELNQWLRNLLYHLESGMCFSHALNQEGRYLQQQELQLIQVGEMTGRLAYVCQQIAQYRQQTLVLQRKVQKVLLYPAVVLGISVLLTLALLLFIVPEFAEMYQNQPLPAFTDFLFRLSTFLREDSMPIMLGGFFSLCLFHVYRQHSPSFAQQKANCLAKLPFLNKILQYHRLVRFTGNLGLMLSAGIPLQQALQSFLVKTQAWQSKGKGQADVQLEKEVRWILQQISQGHAFSAAVGGTSFPYDAQQMLQIGEKSGKLVQMLQHVAQAYQKKLEHQLDLFAQLLEPLFMLIIGGLIGVIMLGIYLPIFNMGAIVQ